MFVHLCLCVCNKFLGLCLVKIGMLFPWWGHQGGWAQWGQHKGFSRKIKQIWKGLSELCHTGTFMARAYSTLVVLVLFPVNNEYHLINKLFNQIINQLIVWIYLCKWLGNLVTTHDADPGWWSSKIRKNPLTKYLNTPLRAFGNKKLKDVAQFLQIFHLDFVVRCTGD